MSGADPISSAVVRAALLSSAREVFRSFERTSMTPNIYDAKDYSVSIFDDEFNLVADCSGLPEFVGSLSFAVAHVAARFRQEGFRLGDVVVANDPFATGAHPPDVAVVAPAIVKGDVIGFCAIRGHMGDIGAKDPYPCDSDNIYEEGLVIPASKFARAGVAGEDLYEVVAANSRMPRETVGNLRSAVASAAAGAAKVEGVVAGHGLASYRAAIAELLARGEHDVRGVLAQIPDGEYRAEARLEFPNEAGEPVPLRCLVRIEGSDITVDTSGSASMQPGPLNVVLPQTMAACRLALKRLTTQDGLTANSGEHRPLTVIAPEGSIFNATRPAGTFMMHTAASLLSEMIVTALTPALPERVPAPSAGHTTGFITGFECDGRWVEVDDIAPIGYGATASGDGANALQHFCIAGIVLSEAEPWEARAPVTKVGLELVTDSGGAGRWRGGLGANVAWRFGAPARMNVQAQKLEAGAEPRRGGGFAGAGNNAVEIRSEDGSVRRVGMSSDLAMAAGDLIVLNGAGGGGHGDPLEREPERVMADVKDGYVSAAAALERYGVVLDRTTLVVDESATERERASRHE